MSVRPARKSAYPTLIIAPATIDGADGLATALSVADEILKSDLSLRLTQLPQVSA